MKAIYINIDPYLQAVADWLNAGATGTVPCFDPLPVAVTIPLGESACIYCAGKGARETDPDTDGFSIDGKTLYFMTPASGAFSDGIPADAIDVNVVPGLSALAAAQKYFVVAVSGNTITVPVWISDGDVLSNNPITFSVPVLVRRETASGPVDLVDFTPPAAAPSAADIKSALVAAGDTALAGVTLGGAILLAKDTDLEDNTIVQNDDGERTIEYLDPSDAVMVVGSQSNS